MQRTVEKVFYALLRFEINGDELCEDVKNLITSETLPALFALAKKHDLAHLIGDALDKNGLLPDGTEAKKRFLQERNMAVYRVEQLRYEYEQVFSILEELKVDYLPLKGTVLRKYYPENWMRTSADVDVLVRKHDLPIIKKVMEEKLGYIEVFATDYDVILESITGFHIEFHFDLITKYDNQKANDILANVWEYTDRIGDAYQRIMHDDYFYYYHLAHMIRHFIDGGCGVRSFLDIWLLNNKCKFDKEKRELLLEKGGLLKFAKASEEMAEIWFSDRPYADESKLYEQFILQGGVYGSADNKVVIQQGKSGSRFRYMMARIFMPLEELQHKYPILKKHKYLYPFMIVRRCCSILFTKRSKRIKEEMQMSSGISKQKQCETIRLINYLGIKEI